MMRLGYVRLIVAWSIGALFAGGALAQAVKDPVAVGSLQLAQGGDDGALIEEEPASPVKADTAKTQPPPAKPAPAVPAVAPKASAAAPTTNKIAPAPAKTPDAGISDLLIEEGEAPPAPAKPAPMDTAQEKPAAPGVNLVGQPAPPSPVSDSVKGAGAADEVLVEEPSRPDTLKHPAPAPAPAKPVIVTESRSINFSENLKGYRSPKLAMLLSLLVPGAGQAYSRCYWKVPVFLAVEAGVIITSVVFLNKGKDYEKQAHQHADTAFSADSFSSYYVKLRRAIRDGYPDRDSLFADSVLQSVYGFYGSSGYIGSSMIYDTAHFNSVVRSRSSTFYEDIQSGQFVYGWKDAYPNRSLDALTQQISRGNPPEGVNPSVDTVITPGGTFVSSPATADYQVYFKYQMVQNGQPSGDPAYGFSAYYTTYKGLLRDRDNNYNYARNILLALIVNHLVSAIDAGLTARAYNDKLMGKQSFWQHIRISPQWVDAGNGAAPGAVVSVDF